MEKNKIHKLSEKDLDKLLNRAFLELDFNQAQNQAVLESLAEQSLTKSTFHFSIKKILLSKLFISVALLLSLVGFWFWPGSRATAAGTDVASAPVKKTTTPQANNTRKIKNAAHHQPSAVIETKIPAGQKQAERNIIARNMAKPAALVETSATSAEVQKAVVSGYIKNTKTRKPIAGALVYRLNSSESVYTDQQGHFALALPKGEHHIGVSMVGYQTYTTAIAVQEDLAKDMELTEVWKQLDEVTVRPKAAVFPNLTESEKRSNEKEKRKMARQAARLRRDRHEQKYAFIPPPADQSLREFYMGGAEVTNLEYRTFLFDLLINDRKEDFLMAKPDQSLWMNAAGVPYFDTLSFIYFSTRKYNTFPVVNISVEGARLYCEWLGQLANQVKEKEGKPKVE